MAQNIIVKVNEKQLTRIMKVVYLWENNPKRCGLIELVDMSSDSDGEKDAGTITLKVSSEITYDVWSRFCQLIRMRIVFPGY